MELYIFIFINGSDCLVECASGGSDCLVECASGGSDCLVECASGGSDYSMECASGVRYYMCGGTPWPVPVECVKSKVLIARGLKRVQGVGNAYAMWT